MDEKVSMRVASDKHRFDVVYQGRWYLLGSLSDHHRYGVDPTGPVRILFDQHLSRKIEVPKDEIHIARNPL